MQVINYGIKFEIFPPLIFLGVGAMTDFGPLLANPNTLFLGAAAGVYPVPPGEVVPGGEIHQPFREYGILWHDWHSGAGRHSSGGHDREQHAADFRHA